MLNMQLLINFQSVRRSLMYCYVFVDFLAINLRCVYLAIILFSLMVYMCSR